MLYFQTKIISQKKISLKMSLYHLPMLCKLGFENPNGLCKVKVILLRSPKLVAKSREDHMISILWGSLTSHLKQTQFLYAYRVMYNDVITQIMWFNRYDSIVKAP